MDDFDAPETPEEVEDTRRLLQGLRDFPLGGQMRSGEMPTPINFQED